MQEHAIDKIHRDHAYLVELMQKVDSVCTNPAPEKACKDCGNTHRVVCNGNLEQLIRTYAEGTLKHHMVESAYMTDAVPKDHRIAHAQAHLAIAERLRAIHVRFCADGNCIKAIEAMDAAFQSVHEHIEKFDGPLEQYLRAST